MISVILVLGEKIYIILIYRKNIVDLAPVFPKDYEGRKRREMERILETESMKPE